MPNIGVVGLGVMGFEAAKCLLKADFDLYGYDPFEHAAKRAAQAGVRLCQSPADLASVSEIILLFVPGPEECRQVIFGKQGIIDQPIENLLIANMSTVGPATNIKLAEELIVCGITLIDTPVLGLPSGVGHWSFPVGAQEEDFNKIKHILRCLGGDDSRIFHVGEVGNGNKLKLLNNLMFGAITVCTAEIMALARHMGLSQKLLFEVPSAADAGTISNLCKAIAHRIIDEDYDDPFFTIQLLKKDNALALDMAREHNAYLDLAETINSINESRCASGFGSTDVSAMWKTLIEKW